MDLTVGSVRSTIFRFSLPLVLTFVISQAYSIVDTVVVSNFCLANDLSCIAAASTVSNLYSSLLSGMAVGFGILTAKAKGSQNLPECKGAVHMSLLFFLGLSLLLGCTVFFFAKSLLILTRVPREILSQSQQVLKVYALSIFFYGMIIMVTVNIENLGNTKVPLYISILSGALNILLDFWVVICLDYGIMGTVWASIICQFLQLAALFLFLAHLMTRMGKPAKRRLSILSEACSYSLPAAFQHTLSALSLIVLQTVVNGHGVVYINGFTAGLLTYSVLNNGIMGYSRGYQVFLSQNYGAGRFDRIRQARQQARWDVLMVAGGISLLLLCIAKPVTRLIIGNKGADAIRFAMHFSLLMIPAYFLNMGLQMKTAMLRVLMFNRQLLFGTILFNTCYILAILIIGAIHVHLISLSLSLAALIELLWLTKIEDLSALSQ